jgi:CRP-like cAMP-binding protein
MQILTRPDVRSRNIELSIVGLLNWLANRFGKAVEGGYLIDLLLTHQEISEIVGTSRVTATRIVGSLLDRGIIQRHQRHFIISLVGAASSKELNLELAQSKDL